MTVLKVISQTTKIAARIFKRETGINRDQSQLLKLISQMSYP